jgi:serine protease Do
VKESSTLKKATSALFLIALFLGGLGWGLLPPDTFRHEDIPAAISLQDGEITGDQIRTELGTFAKLAKELKPSVVNISVVKPLQDNRWSRSQPGLGPEALGQGSGVIISAEGEVLTNNHVVSGASTITVKLSNGRELDAKVVGADLSTDLALLRVEPTEGHLPVARLGDSDKLEVGDWVMAIGNPFGLEATVTVGVLSGKGRSIGASDYDDFLQTDASINPGNSGGPLFNTNGEVVGINTAIVPGGQGIGFSIPINLAKEVCRQLRESGQVVRGFIGVGIQPLTPALKSALALDEKVDGALISALMPDGPAERAGLKVGDVVVSVDGSPVHSSRELLNLVARLKVGQTSPFAILRKDESKTIHVPIIKRPDSLAESPVADPVEPERSKARLGLEVTDLSGGKEAGVMVLDVLAESPAARAGVERGDIIRRVGATPIHGAEEFAQLVNETAGTVALLVERQGRTMYLAIDG